MGGGGTTSDNLNRIFLIQKIVVLRIVHQMNNIRLEQCAEMFKQSKINTLPSILEVYNFDCKKRVFLLTEQNT